MGGGDHRAKRKYVMLLLCDAAKNKWQNATGCRLQVVLGGRPNKTGLYLRDI